VIEHLVLEHDDLKAVNTADQENVKPHTGGNAVCEDGYVKARLTKASWNVIRLGQARS
jgi:alpha-N-arabinofuranosidase